MRRGRGSCMVCVIVCVILVGGGGMRGCKGWGDHRDEEGCVMGDYWVNLRKADWKAYRGDVGSDGCRIVQAGSDGDVNSC